MGQTYVWLDIRGRFLCVHESHTHTGKHCTGSFTSDIDKAYVATRLPKFTDRTDESDLVPVPAKATRIVQIGAICPSKEPVQCPATQP